jgi:hypothetical protein
LGVEISRRDRKKTPVRIDRPMDLNAERDSITKDREHGMVGTVDGVKDSVGHVGVKPLVQPRLLELVGGE